MSDLFSPYTDWLGLPREVDHPNFYQLLGLPEFEQNVETIQAAVERTMQKVRDLSAGEHTNAQAKLVEELNRARVVLQNPEQKQAYDHTLRNMQPATAPKVDPPAAAAAPVAPTTLAAPETPVSPAKEAAAPTMPGAEFGQWTQFVDPQYSAPAQPSPAVAQEPVRAELGNQLAGQLGNAPNQLPPNWQVAQPGYPAPNPAANYPYSQGQPGPGNYPGGNYPGQPYPSMPQYPPPGMTPEQAWYAQQMAAQQHAQQHYPPQQPYGWPPQGPGPGQMPPQYGNQQPYWQQPTNQYPQQAYPPAYYPPPPSGPPGGMHSSPPPAPPPYQGGQPHSHYAATPAANVGLPDPMAPIEMSSSTTAPFPPTKPGAARVSSQIPEARDTATGHRNRWHPDEDESQAVEKPTPVAAAKPIAVKNSSPSYSPEDEAEKKLEGLLIPFGLAAGGGLILLAVVLAVMNSGKNTVATVPPTPQKPPAVQPNQPPAATPIVPTTTPPMPVIPPPGSEPRPPVVPEIKPQPEPKPEPAPFDPFAPDPAMPKPEPEPNPAPAPEPKPEPEPAPMPDPKPMPVEEKPTREEVQRLAKTLTDVRVALSEQNTTEADQLLKSVAKMRMLPEHRAKFERLEELSKLVAQCVVAIQMTIPKFEPGSTITIGNSTMISIVEGTSEYIVIRISGTNKKYLIAEMPLGLSMALADMSLDSSEPVNLVVKGAYVLARARDSTQLDKAREWFGDAQARGVKDVERLMPLFEDSYEAMEADLK